MLTTRKVLGVFSLLLCLLCVTQSGVAQTDLASRLVSQVSAISTGADTKARGAAIKKRLDELGIKYHVEPFTFGDRQGENIVAELPAGKVTTQLMLGAHYDRLKDGQGAVDNASGSAAVLELLAAFKEKPLKEYAVSATFFDLEEIGLLGRPNTLKRMKGKTCPRFS